MVTNLCSDAVCNHPEFNVDHLPPCTHEQEDTRVFIYVSDALKNGYETVTIHTVDTDVLVLAVYIIPLLDVDELWVAFGTATNLRYIPAHSIAMELGPQKSAALPLFHSLTCCDTVSPFYNKGKKTAWESWNGYEALTQVLSDIMVSPNELSDEQIAVIERFIILTYCRTSETTDINTARRELFVARNQSMDNIPPTKDALIQHIKRATYQGAHIWGNTLELEPDLPSPSEWGWQNPECWQPLWTTQDEASVSVCTLIHCGCTKGCTRNCKCNKAGLKCTELCKCTGDCLNNV